MRARVLIADDHATVRVGLSAILVASGYEVVAEASSADDAMRLLASAKVDAFVTDLAMPDTSLNDGLDALTAVVTTYPHVSVVVLTMLRRPATIQAVHRLGVAGLVDKADSLDEVLQALRLALSGKRYISPSLRELLGDSPADGAPVESLLSPREHDILKLMSEGKPVNQIAQMLGTSPNTVSMQKSSLMRKLGLRNNTDLLEYFARHDASGMPP
jgi:two-component system capsular synthesis response regulator RcsB